MQKIIFLHEKEWMREFTVLWAILTIGLYPSKPNDLSWVGKDPCQHWMWFLVSTGTLDFGQKEDEGVCANETQVLLLMFKTF